MMAQQAKVETESSAKADVAPGASTKAADKPSLKFSFRHAPWDDVLQWLAEEADLSFSSDVVPTGTFNYIDEDQSFTAKQAIDLVNGYLLIKGYTLVRKGKMLLVIDLEDELDAQLVRDLLIETPASDLKDRGEYEITKTRFNLDKVDAAEAEKQINQLLSPVGSIIVMPGAKQILATETAGTLRMIQEILASLEKTATAEEKGKLHAYRLNIASADEVLAVARPLLGIEEEQFASEDGSIRISADPLGRTVFATGASEKIKLVEQIVREVDSRDTTSSGAGPGEAAQFMSHKVSTADSPAVLRVLQTLFVGDPTLRLEIDASTGGIIAFAKPSQHRAIKATIAEMEQNPESVQVIPLQYTDPAAAIMLVEKLFSTSQKPPIVDGTLVPPQLVVRGSQAQIEQIRLLLDDIGERGGPNALSGTTRGPRTGNVRMIPMAPETATMAIERIRSIWPDLRRNEIKVVLPGEDQGLLRMQRLHSEGPRSRGPEDGRPARKVRPEDADDSAQPEKPREVKQNKSKEAISSAPADFETRHVSDLDDNQLAQVESDDAGDDADSEAAELELANDNEELSSQETPPIVIAPTPDGLMISSEDTEALNAIQSLVEAFAASGPTAGPRFNLFYLRHIEAETASTLVTSILTGVMTPTTTASTTTGASVGSVLQQQTSSLAATLPHMVADKRLNALFVHGDPTQVAMVKQLLRVIDIESGPEEVLTFPKPQFIPVMNTDAEAVAKVLREVYANRIETGESNNRRNDESREQRGGGFRGFFGGRGGGNDRGNQNTQQTAGDLPKMTIGVDTESNSIVVSAPGPLLKEVVAVVRELDQRASEKPPESIAVVNLKRTDPYIVQQTLVGVLGDLVETSNSSSSSSGRASSNGSGGRTGGTPFGGATGGGTANDIINRIRAAQGGGDRGGFGGGARGGGDRGGRGGGDRGGVFGGRDRGGRGGGDRGGRGGAERGGGRGR